HLAARRAHLPRRLFHPKPNRPRDHHLKRRQDISSQQRRQSISSQPKTRRSPPHHVISTEGGAFAAIVERSLYLHFSPVIPYPSSFDEPPPRPLEHARRRLRRTRSSTLQRLALMGTKARRRAPHRRRSHPHRSCKRHLARSPSRRLAGSIRQ